MPEPTGSASRDPRLASTGSFGPFVLDRDEGTLRRRGVEIELPARSLRLLDALVRSAGRVVSKDGLIDEGRQAAVWILAPEIGRARRRERV